MKLLVALFFIGLISACTSKDTKDATTLAEDAATVVEDVVEKQ